MGRHLIAPTLIMTDVSSKPLQGFGTACRVWNRCKGLEPLAGFKTAARVLLMLFHQVNDFFIDFADLFFVEFDYFSVVCH
jgi:hypothetical protein